MPITFETFITSPVLNPCAYESTFPLVVRITVVILTSGQDKHSIEKTRSSPYSPSSSSKSMTSARVLKSPFLTVVFIAVCSFIDNTGCGSVSLKNGGSLTFRTVTFRHTPPKALHVFMKL